MTEHLDIFKKANHGELHKYSLLRETALLYTVLRLKHLAKKKNFDSKKTKIRKKVKQTCSFCQPINFFMVIIILFNRSLFCLIDFFMKPCKFYS